MIQFVFGVENSVVMEMLTLMLFLPILFYFRGYCIEGIYAFLKKSATKEGVIAFCVCLASFTGLIVMLYMGYAAGHGDKLVLLRFRADWFFLSAASMLVFFSPTKYWEKKSLTVVKKAPCLKAADAISTVLIYIGGGIALLTAVMWLYGGYGPEVAVNRFLSVLIVSCPVAVNLVASVALMAGMERAEKHDIHFVNGAALEKLDHIDTLYVSKHGIITSDNISVGGVYGIRSNLTEVEVPFYFSVAASIELKSTYFATEALLERCKRWKVSLLPVESMKEISEDGVSGVVQGTRYYAGTITYLELNGHTVSEEVRKAYDVLLSEGKSVLLLANEEEILLMIAILEEVRPECITEMKKLKDMNIKLVMLSKEDEWTTKKHGTYFGIDETVCHMSDEKLLQIVKARKEEGHKVAVLGAACKEADVRIGRSADATVCLTKDEMARTVEAVRISKKVMLRIKENIWCVFFFHALSIPIAAGVLHNRFAIDMHPVIAAALMCISAIFVIANTLRLRK
ncbi:MAG: HAD family hydrolase [Lachnospiraceae bacterium]|nr:HAD family hydrolase [Lachnospiraceae bacterium]